MQNLFKLNCPLQRIALTRSPFRGVAGQEGPEPPATTRVTCEIFINAMRIFWHGVHHLHITVWMFKTFANAHPNNANSQNIVSFWGTSSPDTVPGLCPWTPLEECRPHTPYTGPPASKTRLRPCLPSFLHLVFGCKLPTATNHVTLLTCWRSSDSVVSSGRRYNTRQLNSRPIDFNYYR